MRCAAGGSWRRCWAIAAPGGTRVASVSRPARSLISHLSYGRGLPATRRWAPRAKEADALTRRVTREPAGERADPVGEFGDGAPAPKKLPLSGVYRPPTYIAAILTHNHEFLDLRRQRFATVGGAIDVRQPAEN